MNNTSKVPSEIEIVTMASATGHDLGEILEMLLQIEVRAWGASGENIGASQEKIKRRITSFPKGVTLATSKEGGPIGSQYAFRLNWGNDLAQLTSWDDLTACGWTDRVHRPDGNTGFLVGVGVLPEFRRQMFKHNLRWQESMRASELLIASTLDNLFGSGVEQVIGNARIPGYHLLAKLPVEEYCHHRRDDGLLFDPVLRFHERMGATVLKPVPYSMEDPDSLNAGCWVLYSRPYD